MKFLNNIVIILLILISNSAYAATVTTFSTAENTIEPGINNQGWWSDSANNVTGNTWYLIGHTPLNREYRNFFSFDISSLSGTVVGAELTLVRGESSVSNEATETIEFFNVSTDAVTLTLNTGNNPAIYEDLGTGTSYGAFEVDGQGVATSTLNFDLNLAALADISSTGQYFSLGGRLISDDGNDSLFSDTGGYDAYLSITTVPVPTAAWLFGSALVGLTGVKRKK